MNALDFVFTAHKYFSSDFSFPFTIPATSSSLIAASSDVATVTTSVATIPTETALTLDVASTNSASAPLGFLLYVATQLQKVFASTLTGGIFFGGPTRNYWMLTLFMYALVNRTMTYASVRQPIRLQFYKRLLLRVSPILFLLHCTMRLLSCIRCRSPNTYPFSWPEPCLISAQNVLWYTFKFTCFSYFMDTFCASLEMRTGPTDSGMTVIEYAVAFAETANLTPTPEVLIAAFLSVTGTLVTSHLVALFNLQAYRLIPTMLHGIATLLYFIYIIVSGRFVQLPSILLLFQIPYIMTLLLLCICTFISLFAAMFIGRRDLRTSIWDGGVGVPGLNEDFYAWLFKWGVIALTSVQEATLLTENEALRMPRTTIADDTDEKDLEEELAIRSGIGFHREWIRTGAVSKNRGNGVPSRRQNFRRALYFVRATARTYFALFLRYLRREEHPEPRLRATTPYSTRGVTPYDENEDEDYVFSDRETSPLFMEEGEESYEASVRDVTPGPAFRGNTLVPQSRKVLGRSVHEDSPFDRESSPFLRENTPVTVERDHRETTPFDTLEQNPPSSYNANPPSIASGDLSSTEEENDGPPTDPLTELFSDIATTISTFVNKPTHDSEDAQVLISHLTSQRILTRSRYRDETETQRLKKFIKHCRDRRRSSTETEEDRYIAEVQKCAVCRTNPRVIVTWPCRCLALCDDCRQTLAMRNFTGCPCCRRKVASYSRIYIP